jgi:hypothetical protein
VAAYCQERLREAGELDDVRLRHVHHYAALTARLEPALRGPGQRDALARLDAEAANLRTALDAAVRMRAAGQALALVNNLAWYWVLRGRLGEACRALESALSVATPGDPATAQAGVWLAGFEMLAGRLVRLDTTLFESIEDPSARARARWFAGFALFGYEDLSASHDLVETALAEFRRLGDEWGTAAALTLLGRHAAMRGDLAALRDSASRDRACSARSATGGASCGPRRTSARCPRSRATTSGRLRCAWRSWRWPRSSGCGARCRRHCRGWAGSPC